jgi:DNA-binding NarL/FixJ family response regulator
MDVTALGMNEMEAIHQLKACCPSVAILVLVIDEVIHKEKDHFFQMFNAGASGCIPSQATSEDLLRAIRTVYRGEVLLSPHSNQGPG